MNMPRLILPIATLVIAFSGGLFSLSRDGVGFNVDYSLAGAGGDSTLVSSFGSIGDIDNQEPLPNPPEVVKALYLTGWTAGSSNVQRLIDLAKTTEINAFVIDIKDYSGVVAYDIQLPDVLKYRAKEVRIPRVNTLIKRLHDEGIYVIARQTVFQDPALAKARPDLAVHNKNTGKNWTDRKGISWMDPSGKETWKYNVAIAKDALERGFDEINFDYIRFPSDGDTSLMSFPFYNGATTLKKDAMREFFRYLRSELAGARISADLFGYTAINVDDLGIGQIIEYAYENFDYVAPMIYPSHFNVNFIGYKKPATNPYEVIKYAMQAGIKKLTAFNNQLLSKTQPTTEPGVDGQKLAIKSKLRPWLQDFTIYGVVYGPEQVLSQIKGVYDAFGFPDQSKADMYGGWMLWDPANRYSVKALKAE